MITLPWWQLALCLYLAFNLGFALRWIHDEMDMNPVWPRTHRYAWWEIVQECSFWVILVILPVSLWALGRVFWKRLAVEMRKRGVHAMPKRNTRRRRVRLGLIAFIVALIAAGMSAQFYGDPTARTIAALGFTVLLALVSALALR